MSADTLVALLWGDDPPRTATKALQTDISSLRRALGDGFVLTEGTGWTLSTTEIDAIRYRSAAKLGRKALAANDPTRAVTLFRTSGSKRQGSWLTRLSASRGNERALDNEAWPHPHH
ncbi:hypothetical protein AAHH99_24175 [Mycobacterium neumannii]